MNFDCFTELMSCLQYEEIKVIGKDMLLHGKTVHVIAMMRRGEQAELCMLMQKEKNKKDNQTSARKGCNRELMQRYVPNDCMSIQKLCIGDFIFECRQAQEGELNECKLDDMLLMAKLTEAGWNIPADHPLYKKEWKQIHLAHYQFQCPYDRLPDWKEAAVKICGSSTLRRYLIEKQAVFTVGTVKKEEEAQIAFSVQSENGTMQDGICYIHNVSLENPWEEIDKRYADAEYKNSMLQFMTAEEFAKMKQDCFDTMEQVCPRGMYFIVIQYECTLPLDLRFYMTEYLDAKADSTAKAEIMQAVEIGQEQGRHGLPLKSALIQSPVTADIKQVHAELFEAYEMVPAWEEQLKG